MKQEKKEVKSQKLVVQLKREFKKKLLNFGLRMYSLLEMNDLITGP